MNNNGKAILVSWPAVGGTTSIPCLMHKQTYLTLATQDYQRWIHYFILNYYRNDYIINYYVDHRLPQGRSGIHFQPGSVMFKTSPPILIQPTPTVVKSG